MRTIVNGLIDNLQKFKDWDNPQYSKMQTFRNIESGLDSRDSRKSVKIAVVDGNGQLGSDVVQVKTARADLHHRLGKILRRIISDVHFVPCTTVIRLKFQS
jgi:hypothetical protein